MRSHFKAEKNSNKLKIDLTCKVPPCFFFFNQAYFIFMYCNTYMIMCQFLRVVVADDFMFS